MHSSSEYILKQIRANNSIKDYLYAKGLSPLKDYGKRMSYSCPFHVDKHPSFSLYLPEDEDNHESYFCFSCKRGGDIISLNAEFMYGGKLGYRESVRDLIKGIVIPEFAELDYLLTSIENLFNDKVEKVDKSFLLENYSLKISYLTRKHLKNSSFSKKEFIFVEDLSKKVDNYLIEQDIDSLKKFYEELIDKRVFSIRLKELGK